jgi:hypothetical protein
VPYHKSAQYQEGRDRVQIPLTHERTPESIGVAVRRRLDG